MTTQLATDPGATLLRTPAPPIPDTLPPGGEWDDALYVLPETLVRAEAFVSPPEYDYWDPRFQHLDEDAQERYAEWFSAVREDGPAPSAHSRADARARPKRKQQRIGPFTGPVDASGRNRP